MDYATHNGAIIVSPNYRLLPEATGEDILEDIYDFWTWLQGDSLSHAVKDAGYPRIKPATDKTLIVGESAGTSPCLYRLLPLVKKKPDPLIHTDVEKVDIWLCN